MKILLELWQWALLLAFAFLILEIFAPSFLFVGFAIGAFFLTLVFLFGQPPWWLVLFLFAIVSGSSFIVLRRTFRRSNDQRMATEDVNQY